MAQYTPGEIKRITFLALIQAPALVNFEDPFAQAQTWLTDMINEGFFEEPTGPASRPTSPSSGGPRPASPRPASPSRPSSRGRDGGNKTPYSGQPLRDPDGPPTDAQVATALKLTDEYSEDDLYSFTKQQVSDLISDLKG